MGLSNKLSCEAGSFSHCYNTHRFLQSEVLRFYFPALEPWVVLSVLLPSCYTQFICRQIWDHWVLRLPPCHVSSPLWLPVSAPPPSLNEYFFLNPWLSDFHTIQFSDSSGYFFVFKFVVVLHLVVRGGNVYLPMPLPWLESPKL